MAESDDLRNAVNHSLLILKNNPAPTNADVRRLPSWWSG